MVDLTAYSKSLVFVANTFQDDIHDRIQPIGVEAGQASFADRAIVLDISDLVYAQAAQRHLLYRLIEPSREGYI